MNFNDQNGQVVGADLSRTSPIYRPGKRIGGLLADQSAVRQSIVRLRAAADGKSKNTKISPKVGGNQ